MRTPIDIEWRKIFEVVHTKGHFRMFVSEHKSGFFYASILYYVPAEHTEIAGFIDFKLKTISGSTEDEVTNSLKRWIDENLGKDYSLRKGEEIGRF